VLDIVGRLPAFRPVAVLDNNSALHGSSLLGVPILGGVDRLAQLWHARDFDAAVVAIVADRAYRAEVFKDGQRLGVPFANVIDPGAAISTQMAIGQGNVFRPFVHIAACCSIGDNNYLAEFTSLGHHSHIGSHCTFAPRVTTAGWVKIGDRAAFGIGVCVDGHVTVDDDVTIEPGAVVVHDVTRG